jgi:GNAT superfamily N-acetyltransferase
MPGNAQRRATTTESGVMIEIRAIAAAAARPLRQAVLRPTQSLAEQVYSFDDLALTFHAGAYDGEQLIGIATVTPEEQPQLGDGPAWRLRGMAVVPVLQGRGIGRQLLERCHAVILERGGRLVWCHGRTSAAAFYRALGYEPYGDEFVSPVTGPHYIFRRRLP